MDMTRRSRWPALLLALFTFATQARAAQPGLAPAQVRVQNAPTPLGRYYGAAKGGYSSASDLQITVQKQPGTYTSTDLAVVVRRMDGTFVHGYKLLKASPDVKFQLPANSMSCSLETRGDKLCNDGVTVCGGSITKKNHFEIAIYTLASVPDPAGNPPALSATSARKADANLRVFKGVGLRGFDPATKEYPATKNTSYLPQPANVTDANTCRPGPEPWPEPEPSHTATAL